MSYPAKAESTAGSTKPLTFDELALPEPVQRGIELVGFTHCTPIQAQVLPLSLAGHDVAGQAQTGTGKTAAFLITIFTRLLRHQVPPPAEPAPRALIIAPTRELVMQIHKDAHALGEATRLALHAVYGGIDYQKQRDILRQGCDILVGTPGRLIDYFKQHVYSLKRVEVLVVDEADRMFDMGFIADLRFMLRRLPPFNKRQSMLFSATLSWDVMELAYEHMNDPTKVTVNPDQLTADNVEQVLYHVGAHEKLAVLLGLLAREKPSRAMLFVNTKRGGEWLAQRLSDNGYNARAITGDLNQRVRLKLVRDFASGELPILVATDVASRGLHIEAVSHVFNYDVPQDAENYIHRIGRTARAGASGKAVTLACEDFVEALEAIEALTGDKIPVGELDESLFVHPKPAHHVRRGPAGGHHATGGHGSEKRGSGSGRRPRRHPGGNAAKSS